MTFLLFKQTKPENTYVDLLTIPQLNLKRKVKGKQQQRNPTDIIKFYGS